jgi:hypothetical protein
MLEHKIPIVHPLIYLEKKKRVCHPLSHVLQEYGLDY